MIRPLLILCCLLPSAALAAEQLATVLQQTTLRAEPFSDAAQILTLKARQQVTVLQRKGGWYQVRSAGQSGWLRMSRVRFGSGATTQNSSSGLGQALSFLTTGRSGSSGVTVATGIRGLDSADVANAKPDHQALKRLKQFQANPDQARQFARNAQLKSQPVGYFAEQ
ncbi:MAG: SH3 domain-containing protein [Pseudomonadota bacterium]